MIDITKAKVGDKVHWHPDYLVEFNEYENGIIKEIPTHTDKAVRVVYHCAGNWEKFMDYTSALTPVIDLFPGWK